MPKLNCSSSLPTARLFCVCVRSALRLIIFCFVYSVSLFLAAAEVQASRSVLINRLEKKRSEEGPHHPQTGRKKKTIPSSSS